MQVLVIFYIFFLVQQKLYFCESGLINSIQTAAANLSPQRLQLFILFHWFFFGGGNYILIILNSPIWTVMQCRSAF